MLVGRSGRSCLTGMQHAGCIQAIPHFCPTSSPAELSTGHVSLHACHSRFLPKASNSCTSPTRASKKLGKTQVLPFGSDAAVTAMQRCLHLSSLPRRGRAGVGLARSYPGFTPDSSGLGGKRLQDARARYLWVLETRRALLPCRSIMMYRQAIP